jgi:molybdopterin synthase catalytic subunit
MRVTLFAAARERAGKSVLEVALPDGANVDALLKAVTTQFPALASLSLRVAVNEEFAVGSDVIPAGAEVALIPPVAGG